MFTAIPGGSMETEVYGGNVGCLVLFYGGVTSAWGPVQETFLSGSIEGSCYV